MTAGGPGPAEQSPPLLDQLRNLRIEPADVGTLVSTHLDVDHVGHHELFSNAEHVVQRRQMEVARGGDERFARGRAHWDAPGLQYRLIDGDHDLSGSTITSNIREMPHPDLVPVTCRRSLGQRPIRHQWHARRHRAESERANRQLAAATHREDPEADARHPKADRR